MATEDFERQIKDGIRWGRFHHDSNNKGKPDKGRTIWGLHPHLEAERPIEGGQDAPLRFARFRLLPFYRNTKVLDRGDPVESNGNFFTGMEIVSNQYFAPPTKGARRVRGSPALVRAFRVCGCVLSLQ